MLDPESRWETYGPHRVVSAEIDEWATVNDGPLPVFAQFPSWAGSRRLPVVVFSHGLGGDRRGYAPLGTHLASHGYVVLHPGFLDARSHLIGSGRLASAVARGPEGDVAVAAAIRPMLFDPEHWSSRVQRVHAVLDSLAGQRHLPLKLNPSGVVVAGHSYGAYTTQLLLGTRLFDAGLGAGSFGHPAVGSGVLISPQGSGDRGLTERSWDTVVLPLLVITAERDLGPHGEGVDWRREPFDRAASSLKHLAIIRDTDHHMGGISTEGTAAAVGATDAWARTVVSALSLAFVEAVRGNAEAGSWLAAGPLPTVVDHAHFGWPA